MREVRSREEIRHYIKRLFTREDVWYKILSVNLNFKQQSIESIISYVYIMSLLCI